MSGPPPSRPLPTFCVVLYSVLLAIIGSFALSLLFASVAAPRSIDRYDDHYVAADRLFWNQFSEFYFLFVLPVCAILGLVGGLLVGRSRRQEQGALPAGGQSSVPPLHAALIGAAVGCCLLMMAGFFSRLSFPDSSPRELIDGAILAELNFVGGSSGAICGLLTWVLLTHRSVHRLFRALAGGSLFVVLSFPLFLVYLTTHHTYARRRRRATSVGHTCVTTPASHAASQYAYWLGAMYLFFGLPASAVLGMIAGAIIGEKRSRRRCQDEPQSRVE